MLHTPSPLPASVFISSELGCRPAKHTDYLEEKRALQQLAQSMVDRPEDVLAQFVDLAMKMTGGVSAGLSLLEPGPDGGVFRWHHVRGRLSAFSGATTPRHYSPCGVTLDVDAPVLTRHSEVLYDWIADAGIVVPEVLLVPLYISGSEPLGTLWIVSDTEGWLDSGHARVATELATFVGIALRMHRTDERLRLALERQELLTREINHRVKNLFALTDSMVRFSARRATTPAELADALSGRIRAMADAHALILDGLTVSGGSTSDLRTLIEAVVRPHDDSLQARVRFAGPQVGCGERAINGLALVLHELATNAVKYGALAGEAGTVDVDWQVAGEALTLTWTETGGKTVAAAPGREGFGSALVQNTVVRQLLGEIGYDWRPEGLTVRISLPLANLAG